MFGNFSQRARPRLHLASFDSGDRLGAYLVVRMAKENPGWGYGRIAGAMKVLGHGIGWSTVKSDFNVIRKQHLGGLLSFYEQAA